MRDKRPVDELSIEELERILAIRKREERQKRLQQMRARGRVLEASDRVETGIDKPIPRPIMTPQPVLESAPAPRAASMMATPPSVSTAATNRVMFEDDEPDDSASVPLVPKGAGAKRAMNSLLLLVEVVAVLGLVFIGVTMALAVGRLESETAEAQKLANEQRLAALPTIAPTAILQVRVEDYVLPGGHIINADGAAQFNLDEFINDVPSHLQTQVVSQVFPVDFRPPPVTSETAQYISIPKLGIDQAIFQGTDWETLKKGVGQVLNGADPGDVTGNVVLAAHNDIYGELFRYLDTMAVGDEFYIQTETHTYTYRVTGYKIVNPTDVYVMEDQGRATVTLISCYPYQVNNKRYVVFAERIDNGL